MGVVGAVTGALDHAAGSVDESIARQFDDEPGGGFADEAGAVLDPTQRASDNTEEDLGTAVEYAAPGALAAIPGGSALVPLIGPASSGDEVLGRTLDPDAEGGLGDAADQVIPDVPNPIPNLPSPSEDGNAALLLALLLGLLALLLGGGRS